MLTAQKIMSKNLIGLLPGSTMLEADKMMQVEGFRHLPIFDMNQKLIGILSDRDVICAIAAHAGGAKVTSFMASPVKVCQVTDSLVDVMTVMNENKISSIMIMKDKDYVGILTTEDLMKCFISVLNQKEDLINKPVSFFLSNTLF
jgi:CBS domain-containing protein